MKTNRHFQGLNDTQVSESRKTHGTNILTPPKKVSPWKLFIEKFEDPVIRMLLFIALISLGVSYVENDYTESIGILIAIFLATGVAFWFEYDANRKFNILSLINNEILHKVYRNGSVTQVPKSDIVVGDLVILETGEEIPADGTLLEAVSLQVDESTLTGEPITSKTTDPLFQDSESTYPSSRVLRGTKVMDGHAIYEVTEVGDLTEFGKVAHRAGEISNEETPLNKQLGQLAKFIGVVGTAIAILTFGVLLIKEIAFGTFTGVQLGLIFIIILSMSVSLTKIWMGILFDLINLLGFKYQPPRFVRKTSWILWLLFGAMTFLILLGIGSLSGIDIFNPDVWIDIKLAEKILHFFMVSVTLVVVSVPEGLPMSVTLSLAMSMRRMLASNNLVRKMHACETMGATTVICTDKTGTLTQNQMKVYKTVFADENTHIDLIHEGISVNSTAYLDYSNPGEVKTIGNPTEAALLLWLNQQGVDYLPIRENAIVKGHISFSTERKYMATIVESPSAGKRVLYVKGAPEIILNMCETVVLKTPDADRPFDKEEILKELLKYQEKAMRTLGFAYEIIENGEERIRNNELVNARLNFLGFTAISDPIREDVPLAVVECLRAGIDVKIVTGDTQGTAVEVARQIGIWKDNNNGGQIITGQEFEKLSDNEARSLVKTLKVMCRARPTDKQRLVQLLQQNNEVVAVTGDGTNDAPALNHAHVGLSMGSGTYVAKEASDITLTDDSFSSIASAIMWGRSIYENIQRFILFQLTINVTALFIVLIGSVFGTHLPLTVTQMLWVNLIMDTFAAAGLASLPPNREVMNNRPRKNEAFIITPEMRKGILYTGISFVVILLVLLYAMSSNGEISRYNLSVYFTIFVMLQFWNMFNAKAFLSGKSAFSNLRKSYGFMLIALIILAGQVIIVHFGGDVFRTAPISLKDWLIIIASTSAVLWIGEITRAIKARKTR
ncbi:plasma-membrane calcium-translocating P-type ATPase [Bacteroidales bacterium 6E]|nr:plasma-membrane calcium-translocating P-type ATPase [Bacteroidales bacterium 6E]